MPLWNESSNQAWTEKNLKAIKNWAKRSRKKKLISHKKMRDAESHMMIQKPNEIQNKPMYFLTRDSASGDHQIADVQNTGSISLRGKPWTAWMTKKCLENEEI